MNEHPPGPGGQGSRRRRRCRFVVAWAVAFPPVVAACGPAPGGREAPRAASAAWTREGLEEQSRLDELRGETAASLGYEPGTTPWEEIPWQPEPGEAALPPPDTPGAALAGVVETLGWTDLLGEGVWEQTTRVWTPTDGEAVGVVLQWGLQDDAVAGRDLRAHMQRVDGVWQVERLERRFHCRRGVSEGGLCV
jgi:hypothetical protein